MWALMILIAVPSVLEAATGDEIIHGAGDVIMRCDASIVNATNNVTTLTYVSERYYFFRCDVFGSRRLIWKTSDRQPFIVAPFTATGRIVSDDEVINYLVERVEVGDKETNTNFTSYLWFYSENYKPEFVQCESFEFSTTAFFDYAASTDTDPPSTSSSSTSTGSTDFVTEGSTDSELTQTGEDIIFALVGLLLLAIVIIVVMICALLRIVYLCKKRHKVDNWNQVKMKQDIRM
jgi:hypothetical protein